VTPTINVPITPASGLGIWKNMNLNKWSKSK
jgi:hypothetical protein